MRIGAIRRDRGIGDADAGQHGGGALAQLRRGRDRDGGCAATSTSCVPSVNTGLSAVIGSWKIMAMRVPRSAPHVAGGSASRSSPSSSDARRRRASIGRQQAEQRQRERRLAAAAFADDADDAPRADRRSTSRSACTAPRARREVDAEVVDLDQASRSWLAPQLRVDRVAQRLAEQREAERRERQRCRRRPAPARPTDRDRCSRRTASSPSWRAAAARRGRGSDSPASSVMTTGIFIWPARPDRPDDVGQTCEQHDARRRTRRAPARLRGRAAP